LLKDRVAFFEELKLGVQRRVAGNHDSLALESLQTMFEHRPIPLFENVQPDLDHQVGANSQNVGIECRMMQFAESQSVGDDGSPQGVAVWKNLGSIE